MRYYCRGAVGRLANLFVACACGWLGSVAARGEESAAPAEIKTFHQLYALSQEQASKGMPVRLKGVVLCYDPGWNQLSIYDGAETAFLSPQLFQTTLEAGLKVEINSSTTFEGGGPALTNIHLQILGHDALPEAKRLEIPQLGGDLNQWIEIRGRVRTAETSLGRLALIVEDKHHLCLTYVMGSATTNNFKWLLGCNVRIRGINGSKTVGDRLETASVFAPGLNEVTALDQPGTKPSEIPVTSIDAVLTRALGSWTNEPVHFSGPIVSYTAGESLVVKDATGSIRAQVIQNTGAQVDERVDVWGYLTVLPDETILGDAYFEVRHPLALNAPPTPSSPPSSGHSKNRPEITGFREISKLRREEASQGFPVRLQGTVTIADPDWGNCFIQDKSGAIYVDLSQRDVTAGQLVEVTGQTSPGGFAPEVVNSRIRVLGTTNLPAPIKTDLEDLADGHLDCHWVQLEGVVRRVTEQLGHATLAVTTPKGRFTAIVLKSNDQPLATNLIDALVSVQGACTSETNSRSQLSGVTLRVPGLEQIRILESVPANPFAVQAAAITSVAMFDPTRLAGRRVKISGSVTLILLGSGFYVQDDSGGIRVNSSQTNVLHIGDAVDVLGFPSMGDFSLYLEEATFQRTGTGSLPKPQLTTAEEILLQGTNDAALVQIEAHLVQRVPRSAHPKLVLQSGPIIFTASLARRPADDTISGIPIGSVLRLTGVCSIQGGEGHEPESFRLLVPVPQDIVILSAPPWWTLQRALMIIGGLALGALLAWGWSGSLRRQVRAQTEVIRKNQQELMAASRQAGMAEVATAVLHNVGNVLNSVNVSASFAMSALHKSKITNVSLVAALMEEHSADLSHFMTHDPKGRSLPDYLAKLGEHLAEEKRSILGELQSLTNNIEHINDIVARQQNYAKVGGVKETVLVTDLIEDAFRMNLCALERHDIHVFREYDTLHSPKITVEKHKLLQILVNLVSNAKNACAESGQAEKRLTIRVTNGDDRIRISFADNGVGIVGENLTRIFSHGFTTRKNGHGFGLHSAALAAHEMGGTLAAQSDGPGRGATFTLELPQSPKQL
jgi:signal transduction histidine kinase